MKKPLLIATLFLSALCNYSYAGGEKDTLTTTFKVNGNAACKAGIETALTDKKGIISVSWDILTKEITITHLSRKMPVSDLHSYIAMAGYDTSELRAKPSKYNLLPDLCKYTREPETE